MTREKAIKIVKEFINGTCLHLVDQEALVTLVPELGESEDERIRKWIVAELQNSLNEIYAMYSGDYDNRDAEDKQRQRCLESAIAWLEKQKEQPKEELVYRLNGLMQDYIKEGKDEEEKKHRFKCYKLFWDSLEDGEFFEQKEQKSAKWTYPYGRNETADRLVSLAECLEMDGDCLFNGYSGTECGKFLKELARKQIGCKPSEWSEEDKYNLSFLIDMLEGLYQREFDIRYMKELSSWLNSLPERFNLQPQQEWSEDNIKELTKFEVAMLHIGMSFFGGSAGLNPNNTNEVKKQAKLLLELVPQQEWSEDIIRKAVKEVGLTQHQINWFKNNVFPPKQEWSEEDEDMRKKAIEYITLYSDEYGDYNEIKKVLDWFKFLRPQPHLKPSEEQKYDGNMDKECIKLCDILNSVPSIDTFESCCGHLKDRYSIWFFCNDIITISRLGRCVERNYSDGKWELLVDSTDTHPTGVFWLRSKVPFQSYDEMEKSVNELCNNIQYWFNTKFDSNFNSDIVKQELHWKPSEEQMSALKSTMYDYKDVDWYNHLSSLYNDLKKL